VNLDEYRVHDRVASFDPAISVRVLSFDRDIARRVMDHGIENHANHVYAQIAPKLATGELTRP